MEKSWKNSRTSDFMPPEKFPLTYHSMKREPECIILGATEQTEESKMQKHFSIIEKKFHLGMDSKEFSKYLKKNHVPLPQKGRTLRECG